MEICRSSSGIIFYGQAGTQETPHDQLLRDGMFARAQTFWDGLWSTACTKETWTQSQIIIGRRCFWFRLGPTYEYSGSANINIWWIDIAGSFNAGVITLSVMACLGGLLRHLGSFGNYHVSIYCTPDQSLWSFVDKDLSLTPLTMVLNFFGRH